ncbi:MAG TPA: hypothetical protein VF678_13985 [bacterium]
MIAPLPEIQFQDAEGKITRAPPGRYKHRIVLHTEDQEEYEALQASMRTGLGADGLAETLLAQNIATAHWLSQRVLTDVTGWDDLFFKGKAVKDGTTAETLQAGSTLESDGTSDSVRKSYRDWCRFQGVLLRTLRALKVEQGQRGKGLGNVGKPGSSGGCGGGRKARKDGSSAEPRRKATAAPVPEPEPVAAGAPVAAPVRREVHALSPRAQRLAAVDALFTGGSNHGEIGKNLEDRFFPRSPIPPGKFPVWVNSGAYPVYPGEVTQVGTMVGSG